MIEDYTTDYNRRSPVISCPSCGETHFVDSHVDDYYGESLIDKYTCSECGSQWENVYSFSYSTVVHLAKPKVSEDEEETNDALKRLGVL